MASEQEQALFTGLVWLAEMGRHLSRCDAARANHCRLQALAEFHYAAHAVGIDLDEILRKVAGETPSEAP